MIFSGQVSQSVGRTMKSATFFPLDNSQVTQLTRTNTRHCNTTEDTTIPNKHKPFHLLEKKDAEREWKPAAGRTTNTGHARKEPSPVDDGGCHAKVVAWHD